MTTPSSSPNSTVGSVHSPRPIGAVTPNARPGAGHAAPTVTAKKPAAVKKPGTVKKAAAGKSSHKGK